MAEFLPVDPFDLIIVGAPGSLSQTKLLPALYHRFCDGQINSISRIVGVAQTEFAEGEFQNFVKAACIDDCDSRFNEKKWQGFQRLLHYRCLDASADLAEWADVKSILASAEATLVGLSIRWEKTFPDEKPLPQVVESTPWRLYEAS